MVARVRKEIAAFPLDDLRTFRPVAEEAGWDGRATHVNRARIRHGMGADALMAGTVEPTAAVVVHEQAAVDADAQVVADDLERAERAICAQQIMSTADRGSDHPELARVIGDFRRISAAHAPILADIAVIFKLFHILADPALDACVAVAGAVEIEFAVKSHQKGIADFPPVPQVGQGAGIAHHSHKKRLLMI